MDVTCDMNEHPMLHHPKRIFPILSRTTSSNFTQDWQWAPLPLADSVKTASNYNFQGAQCTFTTAFNLDVIVTTFLQYGWPINHSSAQLPCSTLDLSCQHPKLLPGYINKEVQHKAVVGPFPYNPFTTDCHFAFVKCGRMQLKCSTHGSRPQVSFQSVCYKRILNDQYLIHPFT